MPRTQSLQGAISANVLGEWYKQHGQDLLDDNVRVALSPDSGVNAEIVRTLLEDPWNFWFFHKGVTALCETWKFSGADARVAPVTFRGLRIVDGAQTVSSIAAALEKAEQKGPTAVADMARAEVPVRFIKLEGREPGFGARITFTNNRTNPITARDMLAMDDVQQRIRDDFALAFGWTYLIRADEDAPEEQDKCSVLEAVIAMASARLTVPALVEAAADIEALWPGDRNLYRQLFSARTSTAEVWRRVRALRIIRAELAEERRRAPPSGRRRSPFSATCSSRTSCSGASETTESVTSPPAGTASWRTCRATCTWRCGTSPPASSTGLRGGARPRPGRASSAWSVSCRTTSG